MTNRYMRVLKSALVAAPFLVAGPALAQDTGGGDVPQNAQGQGQGNSGSPGGMNNGDTIDPGNRAPNQVPNSNDPNAPSNMNAHDPNDNSQKNANDNTQKPKPKHHKSTGTSGSDTQTQ